MTGNDRLISEHDHVIMLNYYIKHLQAFKTRSIVPVPVNKPFQIY